MSFLFIAKVDNLISNIIRQYVKVVFIGSHIDTRACSHAGGRTGKHTLFFPLISQPPWSGLFWIYPTALFISLWLWIGDIAGMDPLSEQNYFPSPTPTENWALKGLYFTIASIDVQHYNSWVAPHFTQPNGLTLRAHQGSRQGSFPSFLFFFWPNFYEIQGLGLIESHSQLAAQHCSMYKVLH